MAWSANASFHAAEKLGLLPPPQPKAYRNGDLLHLRPAGVARNSSIPARPTNSRPGKYAMQPLRQGRVDDRAIRATHPAVLGREPPGQEGNPLDVAGVGVLAEFQDDLPGVEPALSWQGPDSVTDPLGLLLVQHRRLRDRLPTLEESPLVLCE